MRSQDAVPDELEIIPEGDTGRTHSRLRDQDRKSLPGGVPIPRTVVQKVGPTSPSHGEVPGTTAHSIRQADAVPDVILQVSDPQPESTSLPDAQNNSRDTSVPRTVLTKVDTDPGRGQVSGKTAYEARKEDAVPDFVEKAGVSG